MYDILIKNGIIYDGDGGKPYAGSVAISEDKIAAVGALDGAEGVIEIDAHGMAIAPGFINMLSHAQIGLLVDGRSQSDIRQGVTLEVMGEGMAAMGPLNDAMKADRRVQAFLPDANYDISWTTLGEYLDHVAGRGISCNVASFTSASVVRVNVLGHVSRAPDAGELARMQALVRQAMEEGALGISSSLIYAPDCYAGTDELIALAKVVGEYNGMYISHVRSEGSRFLEAVDELIRIAREGGCAAEIYHLKASGKDYWGKMDGAIARVEQARAAGLAISADMYTYTASGTSVASNIPGWAHEGGRSALLARLRDPQARARIKQDMAVKNGEWESHLAAAGAENILLVSFKRDDMKPLMGKTLAEVAAMRGQPADEVLLDLVLEDEANPSAVYFKMSEDNIRKQIRVPWVSFCSDSPSLAPEGVFLKSSTHPRAYGNFARLIEKYVVNERIIPLEEAIYRLTMLAATNLKIQKRGALRDGYYADVVVFDPAAVHEHTTFQDAHRYATGMSHVFVNGVQVLKDGEHTGAKPGMVVRGPGWKG
ncbi:MAG: amidohydrolase family protein [Chloroflexi bacterium]|nr:amidohydrolase family protein [Chloroflexota bacterium]